MPRSKADRQFPYYPAFLDLRRKRVVVVGGGTIATGKVEGLLPCGPEPLVVVAPEVSEAIRVAAEAGQLAWIPRGYEAGDLVGADLAFGATDDRALNARVAAEARRLGVPILAVDDIPNCDFIAPSLVKRGNLTIAMSTGGRSPAMARWLRERLDEAVPAHWATLLEIAAAVRDQLGDTRRQIPPDRWQSALNAVLPFVERGDEATAKERLCRELTGEGAKGRGGEAVPVSLVGAGPGDPELLTLKAARRLAEAEVVVYDRLVSREILALCQGAELIDVGKEPGKHDVPQEGINALLVQLAKSGKRVVRLKGGDPFVFGRGGEEAIALAAAGIPCEIVPGISSAIAVPAAAGIPVTHRAVAPSVTVLTGHGRAGDAPDHDWGAVARMRGTLVFLMAVENLSRIVGQLIAHGRAADEPAALVQSGTTPEQRVVSAPLGHIVPAAREAGITSPAVLVVGDTVRLAGQILGREPSEGWFNSETQRNEGVAAGMT
ncbi:MAG TPA: siroheme synthase CysG [Chloroflexota bacterium]|nr:siroheme synthase CysG [Chloroflexota bacterium]